MAKGLPRLKKLDSITGNRDGKLRRIRRVKNPIEEKDAVNKLALDNAITARIAAGTAQGQLAHWDASAAQWIAAATSDLFWDNVNKRLELNEIRARTGAGLKLFDDGGNGIFVEDGGNVGIGTDSPGAKLEIRDSADVVIKIPKTGQSSAYIRKTTPCLDFISAGNSTRRDIQFIGAADINSSETINMIIEGDTGNVGIGTDTPGEPLHVITTGKSVLFESEGPGASVIGIKNTEGFFKIRANDADFDIFDVDQAAVRLKILDNGNVGIGTTTPTQPLSVKEKASMTAIGGIAIKLTNKSGANSVAGQLVETDTANDDAVTVATSGDVDVIGVFLEDGVSDGSEAWVVVAGIADVMMMDNVAAVRGNWVAMSRTENGVALNQASPAAAPQHFEEIGHCIENVSATGGGTNIKARCVLHFN